MADPIKGVNWYSQRCSGKHSDEILISCLTNQISGGYQWIGARTHDVLLLMEMFLAVTIELALYLYVYMCIIHILQIV